MSDARGANKAAGDARGANNNTGDARGTNKATGDARGAMNAAGDAHGTSAAEARAAEAELRKLAHALEVDDAALGMLAGVPAADLRLLRQQVSEALFRADRHFFARVATLSRTVPGALAAKLTETVLPPLIAARTAELLDPAKAADLVTRISPRYLADVSTYLDAARAPEVIAAIPSDRVASVGAELARRKEWVVIGGFVSQVGEDALAATVRGYDGEQLLRIGFVLDDTSRLDVIGAILTERQIDQLLAAAAEQGLWDELANLLAHLSTERRERLAARYGRAPEVVRAAYETAGGDGSLDAATLELLTATT